MFGPCKEAILQESPQGHQGPGPAASTLEPLDSDATLLSGALGWTAASGCKGHPPRAHRGSRVLSQEPRVEGRSLSCYPALCTCPDSCSCAAGPFASDWN